MQCFEITLIPNLSKWKQCQNGKMQNAHVQTWYEKVDAWWNRMTVYFKEKSNGFLSARISSSLTWIYFVTDGSSIRLHEARTSFSTVPFFWFSTESQSSSRKKNMWSVWGSQTTTCWTYQDGSRPAFTLMILRPLTLSTEGMLHYMFLGMDFVFGVKNGMTPA